MATELSSVVTNWTMHFIHQYTQQNIYSYDTFYNQTAAIVTFFHLKAAGRVGRVPPEEDFMQLILNITHWAGNKKIKK